MFKDKPGGLIVDYLGLADELKQALATYTEAGGKGKGALDQAEAVAVMLEKYEVCRGLFHGFEWSHWTTGTPQARLALLPAAQEHILAQDDGKSRLLRSVTDLSKAFALSVMTNGRRSGCPHPFTEAIYKCRAEIGHQVDPNRLRLFDFGVDVNNLFVQFSFVEETHLSSQEVLDNSNAISPAANLLAIPFAPDTIAELMLGSCWEPAALAGFIALASRRCGTQKLQQKLAAYEDQWRSNMAANTLPTAEESPRINSRH